MSEQQQPREVPCTSCTNGMIRIPKMEMDKKGNPMIVMDLITCIVCTGNGRVTI